MHSALQGHYPWTSRNQANQRAQKKAQTESVAPKKCVFKKKKHPHPHTKKYIWIEEWILIKSWKFSPHFSTFLACYGMLPYVWFHRTTPFFTLREYVFFRQSIHTATGRPCRRAPQTKIGEHHAYQVERQQAAIPLPMSVVWRIILKQFMSFTMVCLEKKRHFSPATPLHPLFLHWFYRGSFCIHSNHMVTGIILQALEPSCKKKKICWM